jgi:glycosyltransferase involved in cell wall biosynthesis
VISKILFGSKARVIWWHHHFPWYYSSHTNVYIKLKKWLEKKSIQKIDILISNSKYLQQSIKSIYNRDSEILYPVLDNKFLNYNINEKCQVFTSPTIFVYGRWVEGKNIKLIFQTYEELKNKIPNLVLKI